SDNPLDAPEGPRPDAEDAEAVEDEEMGDAADAADGEEDTKKEMDGDKDGAEGIDAPADGQQTQTKSSLESQARSHLIAQTHAIILPSYSTWFDMHQIHNLERKALPEFFNSRNRSKTPAIYKDYRDFMINTYRLNPTEYLTVTACRRNLAGDVCAIMRVHAFLEQWGLINYQVDPDTRPSTIGPPFTGHFRIVADTPRGLQPLQPAPGSTSTSGKAHATTERLASAAPPIKSDLNLEIRRNVYDTNGKDVTPAEVKDKPSADGEGSGANRTPAADGSTKSLEDALKEPGKQYHCYSCGIDCSRVRYHNSKAPPHSAQGKTGAMSKWDLCPNCFMEGRFPASTTASDYTKLENEKYSALPDREAPWSDAETLLLLEGLELFDDSWNDVSDHVGTRTREECILKFLQLEIEDKYLEPEPAPELNGNGRIPFTQSDNPVLSVMSFLAGLAEPNVTAAAAGKSVEEMKKTLRERLEKANTTGKGKGKATEDDSADKPAESTEESAAAEKPSEVKNEDSMDVDQPAAAASPQPAEDNAVAIADPKKTGANPQVTVPLALSAARASALASHEERHLTRLVSAATNLQLQKLDLKLQQFSELESLLSAERRDLERRRQQLFLDRLAFQKRMRSVEDTFNRACSLSPNE
ncbi:SWIRM-domain-containing protein, partial [Rhizodiscina lignyota]